MMAWHIKRMNNYCVCVPIKIEWMNCILGHILTENLSISIFCFDFHYRKRGFGTQKLNHTSYYTYVSNGFMALVQLNFTM